MSTPPPADAPTGPAADPVRPWWRSGWRRYLFPGVWLAYLAETWAGVQEYQTGWAAIAGYAIVLAFAACYVVAVSEQWGPAHSWRRLAFPALWLLWLAETAFARQHAFVMCIFLTVLAVARWGRKALPAVVLLSATAAFGPALVPAWHAGIQSVWLFTIPIVALSMWGFFSVVRTNAELTAARSEVARLAAENERTRIARDLHDLLGHSLTTITVKAGLARRLAERGQPDRALAEIGEVERLSRRTLADVRAAVSGQRDIRLASELATAREVLRAAGIAADLPASVDIVDPALSELFGWIVREGVTNVVRHSRASRCGIVLGPGSMEIVDDGRGGSPAGGPGTGLTGLRERVAAAGGTVSAGGNGRGWRLRVDIPLPARPARPGHLTTPTIST
ncbi:MAG: two-component system, NarL family, sensor histidine kinase DesK [Micromonosporaceae bacterium]